jgi:N-acetylated-alpha-linked acidic dipeptidase
MTVSKIAILSLFPTKLYTILYDFPGYSQLYSPPEDYESELLFFPGIADAISRSGDHSAKQRQAAVRQEMWRVSMAIQRAASVLRGEFSSHDKPLSFTVSLDP